MNINKTISIIVICLFGFFDLFGQGQNFETLTIEQCLKLANEKQQEENVRDASYFLNAAAEKLWEIKDYQKAIEHYNQSIKLNETVSNWNGIAGIHCNLGLIYFDMGEYENSYQYLRKAYQYRKDQNEKLSVINQLINISVTLNKIGRYDESIKALEEGLSISRDLNNYEEMRSCFGMLSETYTLAGNTEKAAEYFHMYKTVHDAISNESEKRHRIEMSEATMKVQLAEMERELAEARRRYADYELAEISKELEELDSEKRALLESKTKAELMIENLQANEKIAEMEKREIEEHLKTERLKARNLIIGLCVTGLIVIIIGLFWWQKQRDNRKLENQNALINRQKADLEAAFSEIRQKNQDLTTTNEKLVQTQKELAEYQEKLEERVVARTSRLMKLLNQVRESDRLKSAFFSNMSHEIRTPLNAILSFSQMINNHNISEKRRTVISNLVRSNSEQLIKMFEDIVSLAEIDSGIISIQRHRYNIHNILKNTYNAALDMVQSDEKDKLEIILHNELPATIGDVLVDGNKISRILIHLVDNAIKNTDSGYVIIGCQAISEENILRFWVEDTGTGIDEKDRESVFTRFWKHGDVITDKFRGLGIGLSLCKELLDILNGKISMTSEVGLGSTFSFTVNYY